MKKIDTCAYAKINLTLDVLKKRDDGYHDIKTIMHTISLCDKINIKQTNSEISVSTNSPILPANKTNSAYIAAKLFFETAKINDGVDIYIEKNIPIAAGTAGGSADAAAVLNCLNVMYDNVLSRNRLLKIGESIGSDIPFCMTGGCMLATSKGEIMSKLPVLPDCYIVVAKPNVFISTKWVYTNLNAEKISERPDTDGCIKALSQQDLKSVAVRMYNVLETVTVEKHPVINIIKQQMIHYGALGSIMSGSGCTVFGLFDDEEKAKYCRQMLKSSDIEVFLSHGISSYFQEA